MNKIDECIELLKQHNYVIKHKSELSDLAKRARDSRQQEIIAKLNKAIVELKQDGIQPTAWRIAKRAGVSYNTAKKYIQQGLVHL